MKIRITETRVHYHELDIDDEIDVEEFEELLQDAMVHDNDIDSCVEKAMGAIEPDLIWGFREDAEGCEIQCIEADELED